MKRRVLIVISLLFVFSCKTTIESSKMKKVESLLIAKGDLYGAGAEGIAEQNMIIDNETDDSLLGHLPITFSAQTSHSEVVLKLPPGAKRLATSPLDDNFSIRYAEKVWGVQFHPEFSVPVMSDYIRYREGALREEGLNPEQLMANSSTTAEANSVLQKFTELVRI